MAEPNEESSNIENAGAPETKAELPNVESPPLSPGHEIKSAEPEKAAAPAPEIKVEPVKPAPFAAAPEAYPQAPPQPQRPAFISMPKLSVPQLTVSRRLRNGAALAATVMIAAGLGAAAGSAVNKRAVPAPVVAQPDTSLIEENHAMQKSIARLTRELASLKTSIETVNKDNRTQIARITDKLADRDKAPETTGSIARPATATAPAAAAATAPAAEPAPLPTPRPPIVQGWTVRDAQNGAAWLEYRGDLYRAVPGIPLPGLGHVEAIRREGNQWVVVTSKGIITSEQTSAAVQRERPYYPPYYRRY
jgi:hypothetical protein